MLRDLIFLFKKLQTTEWNESSDSLFKDDSRAVPLV